MGFRFHRRQAIFWVGLAVAVVVALGATIAVDHYRKRESERVARIETERAEQERFEQLRNEAAIVLRATNGDKEAAATLERMRVSAEQARRIEIERPLGEARREVLEPQRNAEIARMEPWQMLAKLDGASRDELKSARFRTFVADLSAKYNETPMGITDKTYVTHTSLKETGIGESSLEILEAMNRTSNFRHANDAYAEHLAVYSVLRQSGQSSTDAVEATSGMKVHEIVRRLTGR